MRIAAADECRTEVDRAVDGLKSKVSACGKELATVDQATGEAGSDQAMVGDTAAFCDERWRCSLTFLGLTPTTRAAPAAVVEVDAKEGGEPPPKII
eukprot:371414-Heterocapsa_arctica.AAC.1